MEVGDAGKGNGSSECIHIEVCQKETSVKTKEEIVSNMKMFILNDSLFKENKYMTDNVKSFNIWDSKGEIVQNFNSDITDDKINFHVYRLQSDQEELAMEDCDENEVQAAGHWSLPHTDFHNMWDTLIYDTDIKENLLNYSSSMLKFSDKGINQDLISWNRVVLLHGPPGTGKTSLCKALAQKLSVRLSKRYEYTCLLEINSHSLFSKWFSESGKLVQKMFQKVEEMLEDPSHLVCLLIDEVESLTAARTNVDSGVEPSDAIRVVNAVLTRIDKLKSFPNLLILTTSNVTGKIDLAFVDRADIKFFVGNPSPLAIYSILKSCIDELMRVGIVQHPPVPMKQASDLHLSSGEGPDNASQCLWDIANKSVGLSGRTLRKLPFLAYAKFLHSSRGEVPILQFLQALSRSVDVQFKERHHLCNGDKANPMN